MLGGKIMKKGKDWKASIISTFLNNKYILSVMGILLLILLFFSQGVLGSKIASDQFILEELESHLDSESLTDEFIIPEDSHIENIYVDIKGAVLKPNMYMLPLNSRIYDLIEIAGGFNEDAAVNHVNLAQILEDQMLVYIYSLSEWEDINDRTDNLQDPTLLFTNPSTEDDKLNELININIASASELETLPNIGPKKAQAIVQFRIDNQSFKVKEDLMNVSGIGIKTYEQLENLISVGP